MLAKRRDIRLKGVSVERTPLLVPSFSSKGFPEVQKIIKTTEEVVEGPTLVSAYDIHYKQIKPPFDFASLIILDSGGYEASKEKDLAELSDYEHHPKDWKQEFHEVVLRDWASVAPTVFISFDHPSERMPFQEQIKRARSMAPGRKDVVREILFKPETKTQRFLEVPELVKQVKNLTDFDIIGVTEKELGNSILDRMIAIATIRRAMDKCHLDVPIHVFGSLDTVTTPMYFLAGADIFDGLTWLRFAYHEGSTIYKHNYGALTLGIKAGAHIIDGRCWSNNYGYLVDLQLDMRRFLNQGDFASFRYHGELFERAVGSMMEGLGD